MCERMLLYTLFLFDRDNPNLQPPLIALATKLELPDKNLNISLLMASNVLECFLPSNSKPIALALCPSRQLNV